MRNVNWTSVEEAKGFEMIPAGGYVCQILRVEDNESKEYLNIEFDVAEGDRKDYFSEQAAFLNFWTGKFIKSYKKTAEKFFKSLLTAAEKSNTNFDIQTFNDPKQLEGKMIGLTIGHEKYLGNDNKEKTRIYVDQTRSVEEIRKGNFDIPKEKINEKLKNAQSLGSDFSLMDTDDDIPF